MNAAESKYFNTAVRMDRALISLLEEKPLDYITVSDICKRAKVNRSTFYLHYENICDLLREASRYLLDGFFTCFPSEDASLSARLSAGEADELFFLTQKYLHPYLVYIRDNARVFSTALAHIRPLGFDAVYQRLFQTVFDPILDHFHYPTADRRYVMLFYLNGINAVVVAWLEGGCRESIEDMSRVIEESVLGANRQMPTLRPLPEGGEENMQDHGLCC